MPVVRLGWLAPARQQALVASSANLPVVYNAHEAGQVKGYPQTPDIRGARAPEN